MFKRALQLLTVTSIYFLTATSYASIVEQADAFEVGDSNAYLQSSTGLTWLDFGINSGKSYNQVVDELDTTFNGWRLPSEAEVKQLFNDIFSSSQSSSINGEYSYWNSSNNNISVFSTIIGSDYTSYDQVSGTYLSSSLGFYMNNDNKLNGASIIIEDRTDNGEPKHIEIGQICCTSINYADFGYADNGSNYYSTLLVKAYPVPESSGVALFGIGLLGLGLARRRKTA